MLLCSYTHIPQKLYCSIYMQNVTTAENWIHQSFSLAHLGLLKIEVLADGSEQSAQALQRLFVVILKQLDNAVMHNRFSQHLELEQLTDELNVSNRTSPSLVLGLLQLFLKPLALGCLKETPKRIFQTKSNTPHGRGEAAVSSITYRCS